MSGILRKLTEKYCDKSQAIYGVTSAQTSDESCVYSCCLDFWMASDHIYNQDRIKIKATTNTAHREATSGERRKNFHDSNQRESPLDINSARASNHHIYTRTLSLDFLRSHRLISEQRFPRRAEAPRPYTPPLSAKKKQR